VNAPGTAALAYAARGWRVLPVKHPKYGGRSPGKNAGSLLGEGWQQQATTARETIEQWWARWPDANVAILLGAELAVLDFAAEAKDQALALLGGRAIETPSVRTGSGGYHVYFAAPAGLKARKLGKSGDPDLELRTGDLIVIAPPSVHESGRAYEWARGLAPHEVKFAPLPARLIERPAGVSGNGTVRGPEITYAQGGRHAALLSYAGWMRRGGFEPGEIEAALQVLNAGRCSPPRSREHVAEIARDIGAKPTERLSEPGFRGADKPVISHPPVRAKRRRSRLDQRLAARRKEWGL